MTLPVNSGTPYQPTIKLVRYLWSKRHWGGLLHQSKQLSKQVFEIFNLSSLETKSSVALFSHVTDGSLTCDMAIRGTPKKTPKVCLSRWFSFPFLVEYVNSLESTLGFRLFVFCDDLGLLEMFTIIGCNNIDGWKITIFLGDTSSW